MAEDRLYLIVTFAFIFSAPSAAMRETSPFCEGALHG